MTYDQLQKFFTTLMGSPDMSIAEAQTYELVRMALDSTNLGQIAELATETGLKVMLTNLVQDEGFSKVDADDQDWRVITFAGESFWYDVLQDEVIDSAGADCLVPRA